MRRPPPRATLFPYTTLFRSPLRGHSVALFTKIYGDKQSPAEAQRIDEPGTIPSVYRGADPRVSKFELELWQNLDRKSTRLNSSHLVISYAVFCLKKKKKHTT